MLCFDLGFVDGSGDRRGGVILRYQRLKSMRERETDHVNDPALSMQRKRVLLVSKLLKVSGVSLGCDMY